jgi:uncharacterized protein
MEFFVQFQNRRGHWLRGVMHLPRSRGRFPGVVFFHGFTGDRMESHWLFVKCARALEKEGIASLRFDFFGSGESDGTFADATLEGEISDAKAAVEFFRKQKGIDRQRIGLLGLSLGGAIAALLAAPIRARALVLWSALAYPHELRALSERVTRPLEDGSGAREYSGHVVSARFLQGLDRVHPLRAIRRFKRPTLVIHLGRDELLPLRHPEAFLRAASARVKEKLIIPGADHTYTSAAWEQEVISRSVSCFVKFLF